MSLVSVTRSLLVEKLFEAKPDQTPLPINTAGQIIRVLVLAAFVAFCLGHWLKPHVMRSIASHSGVAAFK